MGVTLDGTTNGISLLAISETPGLGMKAEDVLVPQFTNKSVDAFSYTKTGSTSDSEIDAISGATYTSNCLKELIEKIKSQAIKNTELHENENVKYIVNAASSLASTIFDLLASVNSSLNLLMHLIK